MFLCPSSVACRFGSVLALGGILLAVACQRPPREGASSAASAELRSAPRHDLSRAEQAGGHTLRRHVGLSDEQLRQRLEREPNIAAASTYTDRETAERVVGLVLEQNRDKIARWLSRQGGHPNLVLDYNGDPAQPIGRTLRRGEDRAQPCSRAVVILKWNGGGEYYVLTSYPECRG
jgi:hypothetical protein